MRNRPTRGALVVAALALCSIGSGLLMTNPASADPRVPRDVWVQCTGFSGPTTQWPHPLTGCTARSGEGSGQTVRTTPGTETIEWNGTFLGGQDNTLIKITSSPVGPTFACPSTHPVAVDVGGEIGPDQQYSGSPVTATICTNGATFLLQPGTLFVIHKL